MSEIEPKAKVHPPFEWYTGFAFKGNGIEFAHIGLGFELQVGIDVRKMYDEWVEWQNPKRNYDKNAAFLQEQAMVETRIREKTGFSPQEMHGFKEELTRQFKGKHNAPFKIRYAGAPGYSLPQP